MSNATNYQKLQDPALLDRALGAYVRFRMPAHRADVRAILIAVENYLDESGYVIVPREPTEAMCEAGRVAMPPGEGYELPDDCPRVWRAMIGAVKND